jgi:hypothetical protein
MSPALHDRLARRELAGCIGISILLFLPGCAQLDQLMGKPADAADSAPTTQTAESASAAPAPDGRPDQAVVPASKLTEQKKAEESKPAGAAKEPPPQRPPQSPAQSAVPASGVIRQPEPDLKKTDQDKALAEKDQTKKEKKPRAASDKKSKKSPKSDAESKSPTEDVFLPPIPLPSKPAAIGGSGG